MRVDDENDNDYVPSLQVHEPPQLPLSPCTSNKAVPGTLPSPCMTTSSSQQQTDNKRPSEVLTISNNDNNRDTHPHTPTKLPPLDSPENGNSVQRMLLLLNNAEVEISRAWESKHGRKMDPDR